MKKIILSTVFCILQLGMSIGKSQENNPKVIVRGTSEIIPDSLIITAYPIDIEQICSKSNTFFSRYSYSRKSGDIFGKFYASFGFTVDSVGKFLSYNTKLLKSNEKKIIDKYVNQILKKTIWDLSEIHSHNCIKKPTTTYKFRIGIVVNKRRKVTIYVTPSMCLYSPSFNLCNVQKNKIPALSDL
jgi:hypothetical protein